MESLNEVFTEQQVNEVADKILKSSIEKVKDELSTKFYDEISSFLDEHYSNKKDEIEKKLIEQITEKYISEPTLFKYTELRRVMFLENKEMLTKTLTDEAIANSVEDVILQYTHRDYHFSWRWKDEIVRIILSNWHLFKDDERVNNGLLRQIENLKSQVANLRQELNEAKASNYVDGLQNGS